MKIKCYNCLEEINIKERYVNLKTIENNKEIENLYFHLNCWKQYFNKKVTEKSINIIKQSVPHVKQMVQGMMEN